MDGVMLTPKQDQQNKSSKRYDRQLRLWGDAGQDALENSHVCLINASAVGTHAYSRRQRMQCDATGRSAASGGVRRGMRKRGANVHTVRVRECGPLEVFSV